jgi:hypothetical protein
MSANSWMPSDEFDKDGLRSLLAGRFRKSHFLPDLDVLESASGDAVAMEIDLARVGCSNEAMIALGSGLKLCREAGSRAS